MNKLYKLAFAVTAAAIIFSVACKKNEAVNKKDNTDADTSLVTRSRQLALGFTNSFQTSLGYTPEKDTKTGNGVKSVVVFDNQHPCGSTVIRKTNTSTPNGGEIRTVIGNTVFTYLCNGVFNNGFNVDAYSLKDTTTVYSGGPDSPASDYTAFDYLVKATDTLYKTISINGAQAHKTTRIVSGVGINEKSSETYKWQNVLAKRTDSNPIITSGTVEFTINYVYSAAGHGSAADLAGRMEYISDTTIRVTFVTAGKPDKVYLVNRATGEVTTA